MEGGGVGTDGEPELRTSGEGGGEKSLHQAAETQRCPLESQPFSSFLLVFIGEITGLLQKLFAVVAAGVAAVADVAAPLAVAATASFFFLNFFLFPG